MPEAMETTAKKTRPQKRDFVIEDEIPIIRQEQTNNWIEKYDRVDQMSDVMKLVVFDELVKKLEKLVGDKSDQDQVKSLVDVLKKFEPEFLL